jgi:murein peptide amidase A
MRILLWGLLPLSLSAHALACADQVVALSSLSEHWEPRSYSHVESRIQGLKGLRRRVIGRVQHEKKPYKLYSLQSLGAPEGKIPVLLSAGVHGDEPAGVEAVLHFLETLSDTDKDRFHFLVFPCVNPIGYEKNTLANGKNQNINRSFLAQTRSTEARSVMAALESQGQRFAFAMDFHEIPHYWADEGFIPEDNPRSAYLYETHADPEKRIGRSMLNALDSDIEICQWASIYRDTAVNGLVTYPVDCRNKHYAAGTSLDAYANAHYTAHSFTNETPISWPMEKRVRTQLSWLRTALDHYARGAHHSPH